MWKKLPSNHPTMYQDPLAREYGIPAVLATGNGTRRIQDGQLNQVSIKFSPAHKKRFPQDKE